MMWLLGARKAILSVLKGAVSYPWQAALIASLCLSLWLYSGKQDAIATIAKRDDTITQMKSASKIATAVQIELNKQVTDKQTKIARMIDDNKTNRRDIVDHSRAYAGRMSAQGYCRKASATPESGAAEGSDGSSADAVVVNRADFDILTHNTARLADVKAWADSLIGEGLAVPVE